MKKRGLISLFFGCITRRHRTHHYPLQQPLANLLKGLPLVVAQQSFDVLGYEPLGLLRLQSPSELPPHRSSEVAESLSLSGD